MLNRKTLDQILRKLPEQKIALIADGCVDIYWEADMRISELSREVPHFPLPIVEERFSLGAGANVAANLAALGVGDIRFAGCIGNDWRGMVFRELFRKIGVSDRYLAASESRITPAYCKPIRGGISPVKYEDPRLDFNNRRPMTEEAEEVLLQNLDQAVSGADLLIVCDQLSDGCMTSRVIERIETIGRKIPVIADSRDRVGLFRGAVVKPNEVETCRALGLPESDAEDEEAMRRAAAMLEQKTGRPVLVTLGSRGALFCEGGRCTLSPAYPVKPPIDFVGAGDSFLAGFAAAFGLDLSIEEKLGFANLVPSVTIRKIGVTGTASPNELQDILSEYTNE